MWVPIDSAGVWVPFAVVLASVAGSAHCALMCGPLVTAATHGILSVVFFHLGRLLGYVGLGALAGYAGSRFLDPRLSLAISLASAAVLGALLFALAFASWKRRPLHLPLPAPFRRALQSSLRLAREHGGVFSFSSGFLSLILPCGWLHAFVLAATTTQDPIRGAGLLFFFWLGTLPALTLGTGIAKRALHLATRRSPRLAAICLFSAGIFVIGSRAIHSFAHPVSHGAPSCHSTAAAAKTPAASP